MIEPPVYQSAVPPTLSLDSAAGRLGVHRRTVMRWITRGHVIAHKDPVSGRVGVEAASVEALAARRVRPR